MLRPLIAAFAGLALLAACSSDPGPATATSEKTIVRTAQVRAIDQQTRQVALLTDDGQSITVVAGPEVRNLGQVRIGDTLTLTYIEDIAVAMADAGADPRPAAAVIAERAAKGERPGMAAASVVHALVEFVSYEPQSGVATFIAPDGVPSSVVVPQDLRAFAAARKPGDRIAVSVARAVAVSMQPIAR